MIPEEFLRATKRKVMYFLIFLLIGVLTFIPLNQCIGVSCAGHLIMGDYVGNVLRVVFHLLNPMVIVSELFFELTGFLSFFAYLIVSAGWYYYLACLAEYALPRKEDA